MKPEVLAPSTPVGLPAGAEIAVTAEESSAGVESVTIVAARVDKTVNKRLMTNIPIYVEALSPFVDSTHSSGLRLRAVGV